ncbi:multicomponent K+:H+ antiporter subunit G [Nitrosomonas sp. Nm51]|uniref:Na+/H+ antiporter subunit G n=1 Tax=Nitrosomonas sp. Nm51 TaxID=133720 RepID=UPI0008BF1554|nr:multicomponent K+:H+ antiporter subunit G [Nitrosomonas sp. Nm51]
MLEFLLSLLVLTGASFAFIGSLGLIRLKDLYTRLHGPTKATTLGVGSLLIASAIYFSTYSEQISLHEFLITIFLFITAPVSAHLLAKAALHLGLPSLAEIPEAEEAGQTEMTGTAQTGATEAFEKNERIGSENASPGEKARPEKSESITKTPGTPDQTRP